MAIEVNTHNIVALTTVMFNAAPGANYLAEFSNYSALEQLASNLAGTDAFNSQFPEGSSLEADINQVLTQNLGIQEGTEAYAEAYNFFEAKLTAGENAGSVLLEAGAYLLSGNADPKFANAVATLQNKIEVGTYYSVDAGRSAESVEELQSVVADVTAEQASVDAAIANIDAMPAESGGEGQTFTLTANADTLTGTAGDDTFLAGANSINAFDTIDGGAGIDTLRVEGSQGLTASIASIEQVSIEGGNAPTYDVADLSGLEQLTFVNPNTDVAVDGLSANQTVGVRGTDEETAATVAVTANVENGTGANLAVDNANVTYNVSAEGSSDVQNVNVTANGERASTVTLSNGFGSTQSLVVNGAADLTLAVGSLGADLTGDATATVDASAATGDVDVTLSNAATVSAVTLGSGDDTLDLSNSDTAQAVAVSDQTFAGGEGRDTLLINGYNDDINALLNADTQTRGNVTGFEVLGLSNLTTTVNVNAAATLGFEEFYLDAAVGNTAGDTFGTIANLQSGSNVVTLENSSEVTLELADATGETDSLGFTVVGEGNFVVNTNEVENVNVQTVSADADYDQATLSGFNASLENLTVSGDQAVLFDARTGFDALESVDASGITADSDASSDEYAATVGVGQGVTVTGSSGDDLIAFGLESNVTGGAGDDLFIAASGAGNTDFATITDFQSGDVIEFGSEVTSIAEATPSLEPGVEATFSHYVSVATGETAEGTLSHFEFAGNTYLVHNATEDTIVELSGSVDLTGLDVNATTTTQVEIA